MAEVVVMAVPDLADLPIAATDHTDVELRSRSGQKGWIMNQRWIAAGLLAACACGAPSMAEAGRMFRFLENKGHNVHFIGPRLPFATFDTEYYHTRYPFNRYYSQQAHSYNGYPEYNR